MRKASSDSERLEEKPFVNWADACVDRLIGGGSLNLVGLNGSGRSRGLRMIAEFFDPADWTSLVWSPGDLTTMGRREMISEIDSLYHACRLPVLLIDDFGEFLMTLDGLWLERMLFSRVFEEATANRLSLRCVVVTHPRDREIVGPGSGLRERACHVHPPELAPTNQEMTSFGCTNAEELLLLTGYNSYLLGVGGDSPSARRGVVHSTAQKWLPSWVGQLDTGHQHRLGVILDRSQPPRWHQDDADPSLTPIVVPRRTESPARCALTESIEIEDLRQLLVGQPWPDRDLRAAARRFRARCGNDPNPLWADNFLSDTRLLDFSRLVEFFQMVLSDLPADVTIRLLSRNWVGGRRVNAADILAALEKAGISPELKSRLRWRLYDQRGDANLHRRELILNSRRASFSLPPARIVIGQDSASNETDAAVAFASSASTYAAWKNGIQVIGGGR